MAIFPTEIAAAITSFKEEANKPTIKSQFNGGYEQKRLKNTRVVRTFTWGFDFLTFDEATTLSNFISESSSFTIFKQIASPSPVPPNFLEIEPSA